MTENITVLIVEDSPIAQIAAKKLLQKAGCVVEVASTGKEGLEKARQKKYHLIFMDIGLEEGTDGFEVTLEIQRDSLNTETSVIILTAHSLESYQDKIKKVRIKEFITKPLRDDQVRAILHQI